MRSCSQYYKIIMLKLKRDGFEPDFIAKYTDLTLSGIAQL